MPGSSWIAEQLAASREGLSSMELVHYSILPFIVSKNDRPTYNVESGENILLQI
jgi:hypothetical protein